MSNEADSISLTVQGNILKTRFPRQDPAYCKYVFHFGDGWTHEAGCLTSITHTSYTDNFSAPFSAQFRSSTYVGWPQLVVSFYGFSSFGNDTLIGYGAIHVPCFQGHYEFDVPLFRPKSRSFWEKLTSWFSGLSPELLDPIAVGKSEYRSTIMTESYGSVVVSFDTLLLKE